MSSGLNTSSACGLCGVSRSNFGSIVGGDLDCEICVRAFSFCSMGDPERRALSSRQLPVASSDGSVSLCEASGCYCDDDELQSASAPESPQSATLHCDVLVWITRVLFASCARAFQNGCTIVTCLAAEGDQPPSDRPQSQIVCRCFDRRLCEGAPSARCAKGLCRCMCEELSVADCEQTSRSRIVRRGLCRALGDAALFSHFKSCIAYSWVVGSASMLEAQLLGYVVADAVAVLKPTKLVGVSFFEAVVLGSPPTLTS